MGPLNGFGLTLSPPPVSRRIGAVSPAIRATPRIIAALVEEAVSVGDVVRLFSFRKGQANLVEITLPDSSICIGKTVEEVTLPQDASLAAIVRDGRVIAPAPSDLFIAGDELLFVASAAAEDQIKDCFIARS